MQLSLGERLPAPGRALGCAAAERRGARVQLVEREVSGERLGAVAVEQLRRLLVGEDGPVGLCAPVAGDRPAVEVMQLVDHGLADVCPGRTPLAAVERRQRDRLALRAGGTVS